MARQTEEVDLIVKAIVEGFDKVAAEMNRTADATEEAAAAAGRGTTRWTELSSKINVAKQAFNQVAGFAKDAYEALKQGAQIEATRQTFDSLTASINTTSDAMLSGLREASLGMVSDFELMQSANRFMAMGLATSTDEASKLTRIATQLGQAMGKGPTEAMEEFALLLANQSIPRLDTFGISAGRVRTKIKELQDATPGLSRETAFLQAVMGEAEVSMSKLEDTSDSTATKIAQLETKWKNLTDAFKAGLAEEASKQINDVAGSVEDLDTALIGSQIASTLGDIVEGVRALAHFLPSTALGMALADKRMKDLAETQRTLAKATEDDRPRFEHWVQARNEQADATDDLTVTEEEYRHEMRRQARQYVDNLELQGEAVKKQKELAEASGFLRNRLLDLAEGFREIQDAAKLEHWEAIRRKTKEAAEAAEEYRTKLAEGRADVAGFFQDITDAEEPMADINDLFWEQIRATDADARTLALAGIATGQFSEAQAQAALKAAIFQESVKRIAEQFADGTIPTIGEAMDRLADLQAKLAEDYTFDLDTSEAEGKLAKIKKDMDKIPRHIKSTIEISEIRTGGTGTFVPTPSPGRGGAERNGADVTSRIRQNQNAGVGETGETLIPD